MPSIFISLQHAVHSQETCILRKYHLWFHKVSGKPNLCKWCLRQHVSELSMHASKLEVIYLSYAQHTTFSPRGDAKVPHYYSVIDQC